MYSTTYTSSSVKYAVTGSNRSFGLSIYCPRFHLLSSFLYFIITPSLGFGYSMYLFSFFTSLLIFSRYRSKFHADLSNSFFIISEFSWMSTFMVPDIMRYFIPIRKSSSDIFPDDHHFALFFIQAGIIFEGFFSMVFESNLIISFFIKYWMPAIKSVSLILSDAHHPALVLIQYGISSVSYTHLTLPTIYSV